MWNECVLEDLLLLPIRNGLTKPSKIRGSGVKMIGMGELFANDRIFSSLEMDLVPVTKKEEDTAAVEMNDLLFARQSLVLEGAGKCSIVVEINEPTVFESHLIRVRIDERKANPKFIYYYFNSPQGKGNIRSIVEQVAAAGIRGKDLIKLKVPCPDISTQNRIVAVLENIDLKIENNNKANDILESQAECYYQRWLDENDGASWERVLLSTVTDSIIRGITTQYVNESDLINLNQKVNKGKRLDKQFFKYLDPNIPVPSEKYARRKDILLNSLGQGTLGRIHFYNEDTDNVVVDQHITIIRAKEMVTTPEYLYLLLASSEFQKYLESCVTGTTGMQMLNISAVRNMEIPIPPYVVQKILTYYASSVFDKVEKNIEENEWLTQLKRTLLPRLISGELDVTNIS